MADFRTLLVESSTEEATDAVRFFEPLEFYPYRISIQASAFHYSSPRIVTRDLYQYDSWEIALLDNMGGWVDVAALGFPWAEEHFTGDAGVTEPVVGGFVPTDDVQQIVEDLSRLAGEPIPRRPRPDLPRPKAPVTNTLSTRRPRRVIVRK